MSMASKSSIATMSSRFKQFSEWLRNEHQVKDLRYIKKSHILHYGQVLNEKIASNEIAASTAQNYLSAVNRVLKHARNDSELHVNAVSECRFQRRTGIAVSSRHVEHLKGINLTSKLGGHLESIILLQKQFGLRFEESCKIDVAFSIKQANEFGTITVSEGTKGGRKRIVPITNNSQIKALEQAYKFQNGKSLIPESSTYIKFKRSCYKAIENESIRFHDFRHTFAQNRYQQLTGVMPPVRTGLKHGLNHHKFIANQLSISLGSAKELDLKARMKVSSELGHNRPEITNAYLG